MRKALSLFLISVAVLLFKAIMLISLVPLMVLLYVGVLVSETIALGITLFQRVTWWAYRIGLLKSNSPARSASRTPGER